MAAVALPYIVCFAHASLKTVFDARGEKRRRGRYFKPVQQRKKLFGPVPGTG